MHEEVVDSKIKRVLVDLTKSGILEEFYLAGGTALALQYGHRKSIDLDWFNKKSFDTAQLKKKLSHLGKINIESEEKNTLNLNFNEVKLSFLGYPYKELFPFIKWQEIKLADPRDIACMKLFAISSRGSKKDFIDLYFILKHHSLSDLIKLLDKKYKNIKYNQVHILKSLVYFTDADKEPKPVMFQEIDWEEVKKEIKKITKQELNQT